MVNLKIPLVRHYHVTRVTTTTTSGTRESMTTSHNVAMPMIRRRTYDGKENCPVWLSVVSIMMVAVAGMFFLVTK